MYIYLYIYTNIYMCQTGNCSNRIYLGEGETKANLIGLQA